MDCSKWIELLLNQTTKYIGEHKKEIATGLSAAAITGVASAMHYVPQNEEARTEGLKEGYEKASKVYEEKFRKQSDYIKQLEEKIKNSDGEKKQFIDDIIEEYESAIRKLLPMYESEIAKLEENNSKTSEEIERMIYLINDYANYKLKLFDIESTSDIYFMIGDIACLDVDCIVNAADSTLLGDKGVSGAIYRAAGDGLVQECTALNGCHVGEAKITKGYNLLAKHIIHTVGPVYRGNRVDEMYLARCYKNSLNLAREYNIHKIAFPAISTGHYGYPVKLAAKIALDTISEWLIENADYPMAVIMCSYDVENYEAYKCI